MNRIRCDGEALHFAVLSPGRFLNHLAGASNEKACGSKLLSYQMLEVQRIAKPEIFLGNLLKDGFKFIHLLRPTFAQCLSLSIAQETGRYNFGGGKNLDSAPLELELDPKKFLH